MRKRERPVDVWGRKQPTSSTSSSRGVWMGRWSLIIAAGHLLQCETTLALPSLGQRIVTSTRKKTTAAAIWSHSDDLTRQQRILLHVLRHSRGGESSSSINWDEPMPSDTDEEEEEMGFLPHDDDDEEEDKDDDQEYTQHEETTLLSHQHSSRPWPPPDGPLPSSSSPPYESDDDDEEEEEESSDLLDSPFLTTFQREIHSIVRDYRKEVSDTFDQLMEDILQSESRQDDATIFPSPTSSGKLPDQVDDEEEDTVDEVEESELEESEDDSFSPAVGTDSREHDEGDEFIVGDTDEEEDDVLYRLQDDVDKTDSNASSPAAMKDESHEELFLSEEEEPSSFVGSSTALPEEDTESLSEPDILEKKARKKRTSKKSKAKASSSPHAAAGHGGKPRGGTSVDLTETTVLTSRTSTTSPLRAGESSSALAQTIRSVFMAVSMLAVAILVSIAFQILKKMLRSNP